MESLTSYVKVIQSVSPLSVASGGATETAISCIGFDRADHIINVGTVEHTVCTSVTASIWESATTGGTYTLISGTLTTINSAGGAVAISGPVATAKPWQKAISTANAGWAVFSAVAVLYNGSGQLPRTQELTATVV